MTRLRTANDPARRRRARRLAPLVALAVLPAPPARAEADFDRHVRPVLERRCAACHGEEKASAGLRLTSAAGLLRGGVSGPAIQPGRPEASYLLRRLRGEGDEDRMPPEGEPLGPEEIALVARWIAGAAAAADPTGLPLPHAPHAPDGTAGPAGPRLWRLTRAEYVNTIAAVFPGVEVTSALPADERRGGFYNNAGALVTDGHLRLYQLAAEEIAAAVVARPALLPAACRAPRGRDCAPALLAEVGRRLYRRPLAPGEAARLRRGVFARLEARDGRRAAIRGLLEALLQSFPFLYRAEIGVPAPELGPGVRRLDDHEVGARLAAFLWTSAPDDELLAAAAAGALRTPEQITDQARRLLADPRARPMLHGFFEQLFRLERVRKAHKDRQLFPGFDEELRRAMIAESHAFVDHVVWSGGGSVETLLTADFGFADQRLAPVYGLALPAGPLRRVTFSREAPRAGLLTQAAFLAAHAGSSSPSVVQRGLTIRENLLCQELPPPPPGTDMNPRLPRLEKQPCAKCHVLMDLVGQGLDDYDAVGRFRAGERPAHGRVLALDGRSVDVQGARALAGEIAGSEQYRRCMVRQWFRYGLGRLEREEDGGRLAALERALDESGGDLRALIVAVTGLDDFRLLRPAP